MGGLSALLAGRLPSRDVSALLGRQQEQEVYASLFGGGPMARGREGQVAAGGEDQMIDPRKYVHVCVCVWMVVVVLSHGHASRHSPGPRVSHSCVLAYVLLPRCA